MTRRPIALAQMTDVHSDVLSRIFKIHGKFPHQPKVIRKYQRTIRNEHTPFLIKLIPKSLAVVFKNLGWSLAVFGLFLLICEVLWLTVKVDYLLSDLDSTVRMIATTVEIILGATALAGLGTFLCSIKYARWLYIECTNSTRLNSVFDQENLIRDLKQEFYGATFFRMTFNNAAGFCSHDILFMEYEGESYALEVLQDVACSHLRIAA